MTYDEDDHVVLHDEHSEYDGEEGTVTQVMETMFGDANYTVSFEDGQEQGVPEDALEPTASGDTEDGGAVADADDANAASEEDDAE